MRIGIFARTFPRSTLEETLDAVCGHGLDLIQLNLACAGLPTLPERLPPALCDRIRRTVEARDLVMAAVSGTCNMIHPDPVEREAGLTRLHTLIRAGRRLGTSVVTLCTGTRHPTDMWAAHPENGSPEAWEDLMRSMEGAVRIAEEAEVTLALEPEVTNVVDSAARARRLINEIASPCLKVVMDGANLFHAGELPRMRDVLREAIDLLQRDIVIAHAKDLSRDGAAGNQAAGTGLLDYDLYLSLLRDAGFDGPLILHGLGEEQVRDATAFLRGKLAGTGPAQQPAP